MRDTMRTTTIIAVLTLSAALAIGCGSPVDKSKGPTPNASSNADVGSNNRSSNNGTTSTSSNNSTANAHPNAQTSGLNNSNNSSCDGCVDADGSCRDGTSPDQCGVGGAACTVCEDGRACFEGTCVTPPDCGPDNCDGCCDSAGQCRSGDADAVCGSGGLACDECVDTEQCIDGTCTRPCAETCDGCCDGETCLSGDTVAMCGTGGDACMTCGSDAQCDSGQCIDTQCADTCAGCCDGQTCLAGDEAGACGVTGDACVTCGDGRACDAGACVVDPASRWELILVSGEVSANNPMDEPWDVIGTADPIVTFELTDPTNGVTYAETSSVAQDDTTPSWNESLLTGVPARAFEQMLVDVWDSDLDLDDYVCGMNIDLSSDPATYQDLFSGAVFSAECTNTDNSAVFARVDFRLQPD